MTKAIVLRGGRKPAPQPRAPKLMPKTKRFLIGELICLSFDAAVAIRRLGDVNGQIDADYCERDLGRKIEPVEETLMRVCGRMIDIEERAELYPQRGKMRSSKPVTDTYAELRKTLAELIEHANNALWELTKNRCSWAQIDRHLHAMNRTTFTLGRMSWSWH